MSSLDASFELLLLVLLLLNFQGYSYYVEGQFLNITKPGLFNMSHNKCEVSCVSLVSTVLIHTLQRLAAGSSASPYGFPWLPGAIHSFLTALGELCS